MREIKFRAWDDENGCFITHERLLNIASYEDLFCMKLMQYTGKKDKNGVEIYEGDIVITTSNALTGKWKHKIFKIEFKEINCLAGAKYMGFDFQFNVDEVEVIGNIYKNPELLESK